MGNKSKYLFGIALLIISCTQSIKDKTELTDSETKKLHQKLTSTSNDFHNVLELFKVINSKLTISKSIEDFEFSVKYEPHFLLAIKENDTLPVNKQDVQRIISKSGGYEHLHCLKLKIENKKWKTELLKYNVSSMNEYSERINYYSFKSQNDMLLIEGNDTLRSAFVNFERSFDLSPVINLTIAFERKTKGRLDRLNFVFDDRVYNNGKIKFELNSELISLFNSPEIKYYKL